mgnify:FL=1
MITFSLVADLNVSSVCNTRIKYYDRYSEGTGIQVRIVYGTEYGASEHHAQALYKK